jgi:sialidase-1
MTRTQFLMTMAAAPLAAATDYRKIKDVLIYKNPRFYSTFPSIVRRPDGELLVAFRRAPDRTLQGFTGHTHTDPNSYLVLVRSRDNGETWTDEPELVWAHPEGGSQDPCMVQLRDGSILCTSYAWYQTPEPAFLRTPVPVAD